MCKILMWLLILYTLNIFYSNLHAKLFRELLLSNYKFMKSINLSFYIIYQY